MALGRAVERKGSDLLLRAFAELGAPEEVGLVSGGEGAALGPLRDLAAELRVDRHAALPGPPPQG